MIDAIKLTSPDDILRLIPRIEEYVKAVQNPGIMPSAFTMYLMQTVINGGGNAEVVVAYDYDINEPLAFARWQVLGLPYLQDVSCDAVYSWKKNLIAIKKLMQRFIDFGFEKNAKRYHGYFYDKRIERVFSSMFKKYHGVETVPINMIYFMGEKL